MNPNAAVPGFAIWLTGLPSSGKTTLAYGLQKRLAAQQIQTLVLDSDEMRAILTPDPTYSREERDWFYAVLARLAAWLAGQGLNVLVAATANRRRYRERARQGIEHFAEVYVQCDLETCRQRDRKGIYAQAAKGEAETVPGLGADYEPPLSPEATVDTTETEPSEAVQLVMEQLRQTALW